MAQISVHDLRTFVRCRSLMCGALRNGRKAVFWGTSRYVARLRDYLPEIDLWKPIAVYCDSGYRSSILSSVLQAHGFERVHNVLGSWQAWTNAGYPVEKEERVGA